MRAADKARRKTPLGPTVESRPIPPYKNAIGRACPLDDSLDNRGGTKLVLRQYERQDKENEDWNGSSANDTSSNRSPVRRMSLLCHEGGKGLAGQNREWWKY